MISFLLSVTALVLGYLVYGKFVERVFGADAGRKTPAARLNDGVDYMPLDWKKGFLIQFLNIAGLGPIFGAVAGAYWGPAAFLWIVLGSIFAGATHDYFAGMLSVRHDGETMAEIVGRYLGTSAKNAMRIFSVILLVLVGVVFVTGPAGILESMTGISKYIWVGGIVVYYMLATILPIDKIIGKIYPIFGAALLVMGVGIIAGIILNGYTIPEIQLANFHPGGKAIFPYLFITIACGAISGFHATQSPIMARCLKDEAEGRRIFYGAMITEGIIALIWAAAAMAFFGDTKALAEAGTAAVVVNTISVGVLGTFGGALALLGVVACPITSGDTAFRSARLAIADAIHLKQGKIANRFYIAIPLFAVGVALTFMDFGIIWRYFAWSNQTLATIMLWASASYLVKNGKLHFITSLPASFMTMVVVTYILAAPEGLKLAAGIANPIGIIAGIAAFGWFLVTAGRTAKGVLETT
ncbi:carbon starvation CstA family protein [Anaerotalea alkaliphila]|uniref:Carbon starvation protein A n=1 Tax=Anaerotalea alkaliphila TaxID=2662126 RepID=A0A7X5HUY8_9FIRM|nr:carbon starvation protein A [Anaerotalea alkaliphila]NDL67137.1 carbon starvation protein A [Anaerotalea alkaliphila]